MKQFSIFLLAATLITTISCKKELLRGNGNDEMETRSVGDFNNVRLKGDGNVTIVKGAVRKVEITDDSNLLSYVESNISNDELKVGYKSSAIITHGNLRIIITTPTLTGITTEGSGNITVSGDFTSTGTFKARIAGSGDFRINAGSAERFEGKIEGSGDMMAFGFTANVAEVKVVGSGDAEIAVNNHLDAHITGSGNIFYRGTPTVSTHINGSGSVVKK